MSRIQIATRAKGGWERAASYLSTARRRAVAGLVTALVVLLGLSTFALSLAAAPASAQSKRLADSAPKPTIVLVHGAWADSLSWSGVIQKLHDDGYSNVIAAPNPLSGLQQDSQDISNLLQTIQGPIVLVGHSYGGAVVSNAAYGNPNVKALVVVDGFLPAQGESVFQLTGAQPGSCLTSGPPSDIFNPVPVSGAPSGDDDLYVKPSVFDSCFANDLSHSQATTAEAAQRPLLMSAGTDVSGPPAWQQIPTWDVVGTIDKVIPPAEQLFMAHRANAHVTQIRAGHISMVSQPAAVTNVIESAARATS